MRCAKQGITSAQSDPWSIPVGVTDVSLDIAFTAVLAKVFKSMEGRKSASTVNMKSVGAFLIAMLRNALMG
jgi:hypothetical protein